MIYELWHADSGNLVNTFESEFDALAAVRAIVRAHGEASAERFFLGTEDARGRSALIATGAALVERAVRADADDAAVAEPVVGRV